MANLTRRQWLKVGLTVGGMATFALSYRDVAKRAIDGLLNGTSGKITRDRIFGNALIPEANAQAGWRQDPHQVISMTQCFGCWTQCGVRVRVDSEKQKVLRIAGNPYHPLSHEHHIDSSVPFSTAMEQLAGESGLAARSTACARGATLLEGLYSPLRILEPMKRVGKRGEGKWQRISFEQLTKEVVEGGDLFGEGHVDGLRAIYDPIAPIDPLHPGFGPKSNQLLVTNTSDDGRDIQGAVEHNTSGRDNATGTTEMDGTSAKNGTRQASEKSVRNKRKWKTKKRKTAKNVERESKRGSGEKMGKVERYSRINSE